jgi:hypothetical protein
MADYATFDTSGFPLVRITFTGASADDENFSRYLDQMRALYDREAPMALIFDAREAAFPGLPYQKQQAKWLKAHDDLMRAHCQGTAYVFSNWLVRKALKGILSLQSQPVPFEVFETPEAAETWARERLNQAD